MHSRVTERSERDVELVSKKYNIYKRIKKCEKWVEVVNGKRQKVDRFRICGVVRLVLVVSVSQSAPSPACEMGFGGFGLAGLYSDVFHVFLPYVLVFLSITDIRKGRSGMLVGPFPG